MQNHTNGKDTRPETTRSETGNDEPNLSTLSMAPSRDEINSRHGALSQSALTDSSPLAGERVAVAPAARSNQSTRPVSLFLVLVVMIAAGGAWVLYQELVALKSELTVYKNEIEVAAREVGDMKSSLSDTDKAVSRTEGELDRKLQQLNSDLSEVSTQTTALQKDWKRAEKAIASIARLSKTLAGVSEQLKDIEARLAQQDAEQKQRADAGQQQTAEVVSQVSELQVTMGALAGSELQTGRRLEKLEAQLANIPSGDAIANIANQLEQLQEQQLYNTQTLESIDAFRRQTNASLEKIYEDIRRYYSNQDEAGGLRSP